MDCKLELLSLVELPVGLGKNGVSLVEDDDGAPTAPVDTTLLSVSVGEEVVIPPPEAEVAEAVPEADCESESVVARGTRFSRTTPRRTPWSGGIVQCSSGVKGGGLCSWGSSWPWRREGRRNAAGYSRKGLT